MHDGPGLESEKRETEIGGNDSDVFVCMRFKELQGTNEVGPHSFPRDLRDGNTNGDKSNRIPEFMANSPCAWHIGLAKCQEASVIAVIKTPLVSGIETRAKSTKFGM